MAAILFSNELKEKRTLLNYLLQNPMVNAKKLGFTLRTPFGTVLELADCPTWIRIMESVRTYWRDENGRFFMPALKL